MSQAVVTYRHNPSPRRGLAAAGIFLIKAIMAIPHLMIVSGLSSLAWPAAYVGYWIVAFTGRLPRSFQDFADWYLQWQTRTFAWYFGVTDEYPPFELHAPDYPVGITVPRNESPSQGWAISGILVFVKVLALLPHLIVLGLLLFVTMIVTWFGFIVTAFTGRLPAGIQDFAMGILQWEARVISWFFGITDEYPPFSVSTRPAV
jgi:hypothetical protein